MVATLASTASHAEVTAIFSAGADCSGKPSAQFRPGGPDVQVTLCLRATEESACGHSVQLEAEDKAASGMFLVVGHKAGASFADATMGKIRKPVAITNPASTNDFGATGDKPATLKAMQPIVTFTLRPARKAKNAAYEIRLGKNSLVSIGKDGSCLQNSEAPISASMQLLRK
ncbi:MAG: hypothetical protein ABI905_09350 [Betaproteobacteria bacterium]